MSEIPVPQEQGAATLDFTHVKVIGITGSGITSINGDGATAQTLAASLGISIVDGGGGVHTFSWKNATGALITGGFGFTGAGEVFIDAQAPLFLNTALPPFGGSTGRLGLYSLFGLQTAFGGPPRALVLDGTSCIRELVTTILIAGQNDDVAITDLNGYNTGLVKSPNVATPYSITGFQYAYGATDSRALFFAYYNAGLGTCTFKHLTGSAAGNQISLRNGKDLTVLPDTITFFAYDPDGQFWKVVNAYVSDETPGNAPGSGVSVADDNAYHDVVTLASLEPGVYFFAGTVDFPHQVTTGSIAVQLTKNGTTQDKNSCEGAQGQAGMTRSIQVAGVIAVNTGDTIKLQCMQQNSGVATLTTTADTKLNFVRIGNVGA